LTVIVKFSGAVVFVTRCILGSFSLWVQYVNSCHVVLNV